MECVMGNAIKLREAEQGLKRAGFVLVKTTPHRKWVHEDGRQVTLPRTVKRGGLDGWLGQSVRNILRESEEGRKRGN